MALGRHIALSGSLLHCRGEMDAMGPEWGKPGRGCGLSEDILGELDIGPGSFSCTHSGPQEGSA